jgi:hypothetical protein
MYEIYEKYYFSWVFYKNQFIQNKFKDLYYKKQFFEKRYSFKLTEFYLELTLFIKQILIKLIFYERLKMANFYFIFKIDLTSSLFNNNKLYRIGELAWV